jgi:Tol biopolymer transport system component/DNA-binding winged helix-turn-helix (wHTH) protein
VPTSPVPQAYFFGPFRIDTGERLLRRDGVVVPLTPKAVDTLFALVEAGGRLVEKDELMRRVWPDTFVEEANLSNQISLLRKAMGDDAAQPRFIETIARRGYRFIAAVSEPVALPAEPVVATASRRVMNRTLAVTLGVIALLAGVTAMAIVRNMRTDVPGVAEPLKITRLTMSGQAKHAAIAPDGRHVAYVTVDADGESLWIRQVASNSRIQVVPAAQVNYVGVTFSPDATSIYYVVREPERPREGALYKVAALGGASVPRRLLTTIDSPPAFSPDGTRIAFVVSSQIEGHSALMIASADGSDARVLATRTMPDEFSWARAGPAWVPSGRSIVTAGQSSDARGRYASVLEVQVADGSQKTLTTHRWNQVGRMAWLADGSGFILVASERLDANQIWHVSYPQGAARPVTRDESKNYHGVSLTADSSLLATVQRDGHASVWLADDAASTPRQVTRGKYDGRFGLAWTPDGRIVFHSMESGNEDIWIMNKDGTGLRQLTLDPGVDERPAVSPDGRHIVFASDRTGSFAVWRMDADGGNETQLTRGRRDVDPIVTADGRSVIYVSSSTGRPTLWKVAIDGGEARQLTELVSTKPALAPAGDLLAFRYLDDPDTHGKLAILRVSDGSLVKVFDGARRGADDRELRWTAGGITYAQPSPGGANIWSQPVEGGPPRQVTHFEGTSIVEHAWSHDGRSLVFARGTANNDVILIANPGGRR